MQCVLLAKKNENNSEQNRQKKQHQLLDAVV